MPLSNVYYEIFFNRLDDIGKAVLSDPIILEYGMRLLQTAKNVKKRTTVARNKMRECARMLIEAKKQIPTTNSIGTILGKDIVILTKNNCKLSSLSKISDHQT